MASLIPISMATISAHPISRCEDFHPGLSFHESQWLSKTIPIPQEVEASTQKGMLDGADGRLRIEPQKLLFSIFFHQSISFITVAFGVRREKGVSSGKDEAKRESAGRRDRPSGIAREQCTKVPRMDSASFRVIFFEGVQASSF